MGHADEKDIREGRVPCYPSELKRNARPHSRGQANVILLTFPQRWAYGAEDRQPDNSGIPSMRGRGVDSKRCYVECRYVAHHQRGSHEQGRDREVRRVEILPNLKVVP